MPRRALSAIEMVILLAAALGVGWLGARLHRQLWHAAQLYEYRSTMRTLEYTMQGMRAQAMAKRRTVQLRVNASLGAFELSTLEESPSPYEILDRTIWLPQGLEISEAPQVLKAFPSGRFSSGMIVVGAPSYNRLFRLITQESGVVRLDEESTL